MGNKNETGRPRTLEEQYPWVSYKGSGAGVVLVSTIFGSLEVSAAAVLVVAGLSAAADLVVLKRLANKNKS